MTRKIPLILIGLIFLLTLKSCCIGVKEEYLGSNMYLSEYDIIDRKILYQTSSCATSGVEIVPMTVLEISYDDNWIIAKSGNKRENSDIEYWIIKNRYLKKPLTSEIIKKNTTQFTNYSSFKSYLIDNDIDLELKKIDN